MAARILDRYVLACMVLDAAIVLVALAFAESLRRTLPYGLQLADKAYLNLSIYGLALGCWLFSAYHFHLYEWHWTVSLRGEFGRILAAVGGFALLFGAGLYLSFRDVPRLLFVYDLPLALVGVVMTHVLARALIAALLRQHTAVRIAIVGTGRLASVLADRLERRSRPWPPTTIVGFIGVDDEPPTFGLTLPVLGCLGDLERTVQQHHITSVFLAQPPEQHALTLDISERLAELPVDVRLLPDVLELASARATVEYVEGMPLLGLRDPALTLPSRLVKYSFDRVASTLGLLALSPVLLLIALAIKLDSPGPVLYRARRIGEGGKPFNMIKFRSMRVGADAKLQEALSALALTQGIYKMPDDPRVTRVGRFIRRASLDELPNLINVLRGEMSIVGPRPEQPFIVAEYEPWQHKRSELRPGMTGWWQVNGRSDKPLHQNTDFDIYYLENYSFWLDLLILGRTVGAVVKGRGAY